MKKLGFGLMRLPTLSDDVTNIDFEKLNKMVDVFMEKGFTYFDTAAPYHKGFSEIAFKNCVSSRYKREEYTVADKLSFFMIDKKEDMEGFFEKQLEKLGVDYIDYYLLHAMGRPSYKKATDFDAFSFVQKKKAEGKIKSVGFSFHDKAEFLDEMLTAHPEMEFVQLQINYLDWEDVNIESKKCLEICKKHNKPVIVMEPVKGGSLVNIPDEADELFKSLNKDASNASWAVRFAASCEGVFMVLSGMSNIEQLNDNISFMEDFKPLTKEEFDATQKVSQIIKESITVPCTNCKYCVDDCPKNIAIPDYFSAYNNLKRFGSKQVVVAKTYYNNISKEHGKASDCIACGKCEGHCPQHIEIRRHLQDVAAAFEKK
ncbi:MAG: aldo/keto reductase [Oscillospiraceae bacterium]|nr:aldo/keto reductase [Oscillospiraceae bacterium]